MRRCALVGAISAVIAFGACWAFLPPQPRWTWHFNTRGPLAQQTLIGFSPGGRWLAIVGYRGDPQNEVLRIWDLRTGESSPRHTLVLPWQPHWQGAPGGFQNGTTFHWSPDDRELSYLAPGRFTHENTLHFVDLESGMESPPWTLPELVWQRPEQQGLEPLRPLPAERVEYSSGGNWLILRRENGVAVAERGSRRIVIALGNVAKAIVTSGERHLFVQELAVTWVAPDLVEKQPSNWIDYDLVTGTKSSVAAEEMPSVELAQPMMPFTSIVSSDGRLVARIDQDRLQRHWLHLFDLPSGRPWGDILGISVGSVLAVILLMEVAVGWWSGFEVSESAGSEGD